MADIVRWEPYQDIVSLRHAMDRMFDEGFFRPLAPFMPWSDGTPAVDVYETDDSIVVKTPIPGVKAEDIQVSLVGDTLTIKAEIKEEKEVKHANYLRRERRMGSYNRSLTLPGGLQSDKAQADYSDGLLTLTFPKAEEVKPKTIKVTTK